MEGVERAREASRVQPGTSPALDRAAAVWPAEPLLLGWAPRAQRRRPARCSAPANGWSAFPREGPLHSHPKWSCAVSCLRRLSLMRVIQVVVVAAAAEEAAARTWAVEAEGRTMVVAYGRRRGPSRRLLDRRCAHLLAPRSPSPAHASTNPPLPAVLCFSGPKEPRGQRGASGHAPQRRVRRRASEACGDGGDREGDAPSATHLPAEQQHIGQRRQWRRPQQRRHGRRWRLRRCRRCSPLGRRWWCRRRRRGCWPRLQGQPRPGDIL